MGKRSDGLHVGMHRAIPVVDSFSRRTARLQTEIRRQARASEIVARSVTPMGDALRRQSKDLQETAPNIQEVISRECAGLKEAMRLDIQNAIQAQAAESLGPGDGTLNYLGLQCLQRLFLVGQQGRYAVAESR
ncbi:hypothetical protein NW755_013276 [Fusarium falciforme]|uniref:Uncharacterized protein n=1 Tax=Fusarium falciforme TaxID=195108 RepID=A0A9W8UW08_9HYPO|nr:hypothetical protein NW755_013276 [Fusarium falciforme]